MPVTRCKWGETMRKLYLAGWVFVMLAAVLGLSRTGDATGASHVYTRPHVEPGLAPSAMGAELQWFQAMRPHCNAVEVETRHKWNPAPAGTTAAGYSAACFALAGRIDRARAILDGLEGEAQWRAAGVVFGVGHPVADAGDDLAAGPIMELVVEYWPNHYMALYHAGMARYGSGDLDRAGHYLERFLEHYDQDDGFTGNARSVLGQLRSARGVL